jgi:uncharacterized membrane protein YjjP (DUF1212 family)
MVLGIWSLVFFGAWPLTLVTAIIGLVLSAGEMQRARHANAKASGMATAGLVCSIIALALGLATAVLLGGRHHFFHFTTSCPLQHYRW